MVYWYLKPMFSRSLSRLVMLILRSEHPMPSKVPHPLIAWEKFENCENLDYGIYWYSKPRFLRSLSRFVMFILRSGLPIAS